MPSRVIRGEINASHSLARVSMEADLTFRALLVAVDDYGRAEADPLMLKALLFPRRAGVSGKDVRVWVDELAAEGCLRVYEVDGVEYLELVNWERHRSNSKRAESSRFPPSTPHIPGISRESPGDSREILDSPKIPARLTSDVCRVTSDEGREGGAGGEPEATPRKAPRAAARSPARLDPQKPENENPRKRPRPAARSPAPLDLGEEQKAALRTWAQEREPWSVPHLRDLIDNCLGYFRGSGTPKADWYATVQTWVRNQRMQHGGVKQNGKDSIQWPSGEEAIESLRSRPQRW